MRISAHVLSLFLCTACAPQASVERARPDAAGQPPALAPGEPFSEEEVPEGAFHYVEVDGARCRDGSAAGVAVRRSRASHHLLIYLEGGSACFNQFMCENTNPSSVGEQRTPPSEGLFALGHPDNAVRDWNIVYVPYCTGDLHAGTNPEGRVAGLAKSQAFVGRLNLEAILARVLPTFSEVEHVVLAGNSAGGAGAQLNALFVRQVFRDRSFALLNDSGALLPEPFAPRCQQRSWRELWGLDASVLKDCGEACDDADDYLADVNRAVSGVAGSGSGLMVSKSDATLRWFYGYGHNGGAAPCGASPVGPPPLMCESDFAAGLAAVQESLGEGMRSFFAESDQHVLTATPAFYGVSAAGTRAVDWVASLLLTGEADSVGSLEAAPACP